MLPKTYHIYKMKKWSRSRFHGLESAHLAHYCSLSMRPVKTTCNCNLLRRSDYLHVTTSPKNMALGTLSRFRVFGQPPAAHFVSLC